MSVTLQLEVTDELMDLLAEATTIYITANKRKPVSKFVWMNSAEGLLRMRQICDDVAFNTNPLKRVTNVELQDMVHKAYLEATGGLPLGRPRVREHRVSLLTEALTDYIEKHQPKTKASVTSTK